MTERVGREGNVYSKFAQLIRDTGYSKPVNIEIATVVDAPPNLRIKLDQDGLTLENGDLIVAEYLTRHERKVTLSSTTIDIQDAALTFENELKPGERVIVVCLDEDMVYVVLDRAVWYA